MAENGQRYRVISLDFVGTVIWKTAMVCGVAVLAFCVALIVVAKLNGVL